MMSPPNLLKHQVHVTLEIHLPLWCLQKIPDFRMGAYDFESCRRCMLFLKPRIPYKFEEIKPKITGTVWKDALDAIPFWTHHGGMNSLSIPPFGGGPWVVADRQTRRQQNVEVCFHVLVAPRIAPCMNDYACVCTLSSYITYLCIRWDRENGAHIHNTSKMVLSIKCFGRQ